MKGRQMADTLASDAEIAALVETISGADADDDGAVRALLVRYPDDPRLHFMLGSVLAGRGLAIEAHSAMSRAVELAPAFALARYQLGFFELTSGEPERALSTWGPLLVAPSNNYLRVFVEGMTHLIRDEFAEAIEKFQAGIALNHENPPMNADIQLLVAECRRLQDRGPASGAGDDEEVSATALLLGRFGGNRTLQ
jgi:tetratricopeptide (TPR) repeat protein